MARTPRAREAQHDIMREADSIPAEGGDIRITPILHGSVQVEFGDTVIHVDPWSSGDYSQAPKASLILVTDIHGDHLDKEAIRSLSQKGTELVVSAAVAEELGAGTVIANGETQEVAGVRIEAIPMYNLTRGPEKGMGPEQGAGADAANDIELRPPTALAPADEKPGLTRMLRMRECSAPSRFLTEFRRPRRGLQTDVSVDRRR